MKQKPSSRSPTAARQGLVRELRAIYAGAMTLEDIMDALGVKSPKTARAWIQEAELEAFLVNGRKRWLTSDVARAIDDAKIRGAAS